MSSCTASPCDCPRQAETVELSDMFGLYANHVELLFSTILHLSLQIPIRLELFSHWFLHRGTVVVIYFTSSIVINKVADALGAWHVLLMCYWSPVPARYKDPTHIRDSDIDRAGNRLRLELRGILRSPDLMVFLFVSI